MKLLLYLWLGAMAFSPAYSAAGARTAQSIEVIVAEPNKQKSFWHRLKEKAQRYWQALLKKLHTPTDDLIRILIIALIVALAISIVVWFLPWPLDVLLATVALIVLLIFLLRYI